MLSSWPKAVTSSHAVSPMLPRVPRAIDRSSWVDPLAINWESHEQFPPNASFCELRPNDPKVN